MKKILISILSASLLATPLITALNKGVNDIKGSVNISKIEANNNKKATAAGWDQPYVASSQSGINMGNLMYVATMHFFQIFLADQFPIANFSAQSLAGMQNYSSNAATAFKYQSTNADLTKTGTLNDFLFSSFNTKDLNYMSVLQLAPNYATNINAGFTGWTYTATAGSTPTLDTSKGTVQPTYEQVADVITATLIQQVAGAAVLGNGSIATAITDFAKTAFNKTITFASIITAFSSIMNLLEETLTTNTPGDFNPSAAKKEITVDMMGGPSGSAYIKNTFLNIPNPLSSTGTAMTQNINFASNSLNTLAFYVAELFLSQSNQSAISDPKQQMQVSSINLLTNYLGVFGGNPNNSTAYSNQFIANNTKLFNVSTPIQWGSYIEYIYNSMGSNYQFQTQNNVKYTYDNFAFGVSDSAFPLSKLSNWNSITNDKNTANSNFNKFFTVSTTTDFYQSQFNYSNAVAQYWIDITSGLTSYLKNANSNISNSILFQVQNNLSANELANQFNVSSVNNGTAKFFQNFNSISSEMDFAFISGNKLTAGVIAGFVVGIIAAFGAGAVATYFFIKNKKTKTSSIKK